MTKHLAFSQQIPYPKCNSFEQGSRWTHRILIKFVTFPSNRQTIVNVGSHQTPAGTIDKFVLMRSRRDLAFGERADATGLSPSTIKDWGKNFSRRPQYATRLLRYADLINQFKSLVHTGEIRLPPNFPRE